MTKDGVIIVCHDHTFERLCEPHTIKNSRVRDTHSSDLPTFKKHMPLHFSSNDDTFERAHDSMDTYTTLEEVFTRLPKDQVIHIEIKNQDDPEATLEVVRLVQHFDRQSTTIIGNLRQDL